MSRSEASSRVASPRWLPSSRVLTHNISAMLSSVRDHDDFFVLQMYKSSSYLIVQFHNMNIILEMVNV